MTNLFLESGCVSVNKHGQKLCGDFYMARREGQRSIAVLSDGLGSGVKANILATLTAQILSTMLANGLPLSSCIETVAKTLPVCKVRRLAYSTFTVMEVDGEKNELYLAQFDNPPAILLRDGKGYPYQRTRRTVGEKEVDESVIRLKAGDILVAFSDGVSNVGLGKTLPDGWPHSDIVKFLEDLWTPEISPQRVASTLVEACVDLALGSPDDDVTVVVYKIRSRQRINVMIGPPKQRADDREILERFFAREGKHVVCGGTTAKMAAKFLGERMVLLEGTGNAEVPSMARVEGIDLVTEGTVTLKKTLELAEQYARGTCVSFGIQNKTDGASALARMLFEEGTDIYFLTGGAVNKAHDIHQIGHTVKMGFVRGIGACLEALGKTVEMEEC